MTTIRLPSTGNWYADTAVGLAIGLLALVVLLGVFEVPGCVRRANRRRG